jgi:Arm DNA-binding domain
MPLSARKAATAGPGKHTDGRGLMLVVKPSGARSWVLRYQLGGKRRDLGLGPWPEVTLTMAREKVLAARRELVSGRDPLTARAQVKVLTFQAAAEALIESKKPGWRNAKHAARWGSTLASYVYPKLGELDVKAIDTAAVLKRMKRADLTVHGFRSTFRDWAGEATSHTREVIEAALAHRLKDKAEAAYARGDLFQKRRKLMEDWATFLSCDGSSVGPEPAEAPPEAAAN